MWFKIGKWCLMTNEWLSGLANHGLLHDYLMSGCQEWLMIAYSPTLSWWRSWTIPLAEELNSASRWTQYNSCWEFNLKQRQLHTVPTITIKPLTDCESTMKSPELTITHHNSSSPPPGAQGWRVDRRIWWSGGFSGPQKMDGYMLGGLYHQNRSK